MQPRVSIIIPAFNASRSMEPTLASLSRQSLEEIEVIVVDDASSDDTAAVAEAHAGRDERFTLIRAEENAGVLVSRALGIRHACAPWIGFMDADDIAHETMFQRLHERCTRDESDITICGTRMIDTEGRMLGVKVGFDRDEVVTDDLFNRFCRREFGSSLMWNKLYRAEIVRPHATATPLWRTDGVEDSIVNFGCFLDARRVSLVREILHDYMIHPDSVTQSAGNQLSFRRLFRAFALAVDLYKDRGEEALQGIAHLYRYQLTGYPIDEVASLQEHAEELEEAVDVLAREYPLGLAMLASNLQRTTEHHAFNKALAEWKSLTGQTTNLFFKALTRRFTR